ncbi:MAG: hypothetical protein UY26_C0003G0056 [Candidatus Jorgensenbacteria bacterium GW2011_GWA1_48_13]|uniref:Uncharacterized protein n=2 Tax=Candidatus Joergenseniibacteriota TaxID=1752739 RepID=A0A0G1YJ52_9BACT|nr:MAG: hypothetical protein UY26_C0003G0056 [Candidatus Jorgensenbacteria bacterium GW2011_GWA1_48_13]KKU99332.1 MAG: hypothetical protein UY32_C0002G0068 [Candidatus Jorgensenbacteria bacterium GW2011_GWC1_48_8]KKW15017.1 MAG: hypothetical protein UY55_C0002G0073 [Candidatus Jorgensenbacteria bacterium GW2011_GWB1_50_10]
MGKERYEPIPEEMQKAESSMERVQQELSKIRERYYAERLEIAQREGIPPEVLEETFLTLDKTHDGGEDKEWQFIRGKIKNLRVSGSRPEKGFTVYVDIDGKQMPMSDAGLFWGKFGDLAKSFSEEQEQVEEALQKDWETIEKGEASQAEAEQAKELLRDILD